MNLRQKCKKLKKENERLKKLKKENERLKNQPVHVIERHSYRSKKYQAAEYIEPYLVTEFGDAYLLRVRESARKRLCGYIKNDIEVYESEDSWNGLKHMVAEISILVKEG